MKNIYWACMDKTGYYLPTINGTRKQAEADARKWNHLAKLEICRVRLVRVRKP